MGISEPFLSQIDESFPEALRAPGRAETIVPAVHSPRTFPLGCDLVMQIAQLRLLALATFALIASGCSAPTPPVAKPDTAPKASSSPTENEASAGTKSPKQESGESGTAIKLTELNWTQLQEIVATHKGKVVVVDIWSTSCEPCLREFPHLVELQKRHPNDVVCISFDCDFIGAKNKPVAHYRDRVLKQLNSQHAEPLINTMSTVAADELFQQLDIDSIPAVYVYDRTGKLSKRFDNRTPVSDTEEGISYEKQIDPLVAELVKAESL